MPLQRVEQGVEYGWISPYPGTGQREGQLELIFTAAHARHGSGAYDYASGTVVEVVGGTTRPSDYMGRTYSFEFSYMYEVQRTNLYDTIMEATSARATV